MAVAITIQSGRTPTDTHNRLPPLLYRVGSGTATGRLGAEQYVGGGVEHDQGRGTNSDNNHIPLHPEMWEDA